MRNKYTGTTQNIKHETLKRVKDFGKMGDSFNEALTRLLDQNDKLHDKDI